MENLFWLDATAWAAIALHLPKNQPGVQRDHPCSEAWVPLEDCPPDDGPPTPLDNRFNRWSGRGHWRRILKALAEDQWITTVVAMDGSSVQAHRCAHSGKGGEGSGDGARSARCFRPYRAAIGNHFPNFPPTWLDQTE
ncbi:MAG: hypothetical protein HWD60_16080 [Defluviicoccus sp.]|nr:MAG: hypothetical protein HWD60_16080 [Defluviicoccus sp.]